ncbi:MFS transporter [Butyrivibrio proteoclasticus]|uniref:MFS transporter n=1 Tax=Butyrivibrio proteoclasticus TaxID=43305 RepID=UPI000AAA58B1|nr:MFS transporter [Butyrivibrio proteoclasticus]
MEKRSLTGLEKFAYGIGAVGKDMVYMLSASYVLYYFQDIMGVSAIAMGIILLVARVFDAFNDPIMGVIVAKTKTKWGKFRPWLMIGTITNTVLLIMMFSAPPTLDGKGLIAYAAITYIMWGVTYTMMDIPYWSMVPAFTETGKEREGLSALARSCAGVGSAIITIVTVMSVAALGSKMAAGSADNITKVYDNSNTAFTVYVVERDADGNPTTNVHEITDAQATLSVTGGSKLFEGSVGDENVADGVIYLKNDNTDYSFTVAGVTLAEGDGNNAIEVSMDSADCGQAVVVIYVPEDEYTAIVATSGSDVSVEMNSTVEVERLGFKYFSIIIGILFVLFITITCVCIKEKSTVDMKTASIGEMFKALLQNDQAMTIVITIVLVNTALYITSNLLIYFFKYDLAGTNWQGNYTLFNTFAGGMQILAMMLLFPLLRKAFTTLKIFYLCVIGEIVGYFILLAMALSGVTNVFVFFIPGFFIMSGAGILNVVVTVFLANTVDYGELKNYRRDESVIFSMQTFVVKLASGIAALVASICLALFNIQKDSAAALDMKGLCDKVANSGVLVSIDNGSVIGLRMIMTVGPVLVLFIALFFFKARYILTDEKLQEISVELVMRKTKEMD